MYNNETCLLWKPYKQVDLHIDKSQNAYLLYIFVDWSKGDR